MITGFNEINGSLNGNVPLIPHASQINYLTQ